MRMKTSGIARGLAAALVLGLASPAHAQGPTCEGVAATHTGTAGDDVLEGTAGRDVFVAFEGNDQIFGRGGDDVACGGSGADQIDGGEGADILIGGRGADLLKGREGFDTLWGREGDDAIDGGEEADGGTDFDTVTYEDSPVAVFVDLEAGVGRPSDAGAISGQGNDSILATEFVVGSDLGDDLYGDEQINRFQAGDGDDLMSGRGAIDSLHGGRGHDIARYTEMTSAVNVNLSRQSARDASGPLDAYGGIEGAYGGQGADRFVGNDRDNEFAGFRGADVFHPKAGNDVVSGGRGRDTILYTSATSGVEVRLARGTGVVGDGEFDILKSIANVRGSDHADTIYGTKRANEVRAGLGPDRINGRGGRDELRGHDGRDVIRGWAGADALYGGTGADALRGGSGNDLLNGGRGPDICRGGDGTDTLKRCP